MKDFNIIHSAQCYQGNINFTYNRETRNMHSFIDNILLSQPILTRGDFFDFDIIQDVVNNSDQNLITYTIGKYNVCKSPTFELVLPPQSRKLRRMRFNESIYRPI